ncbi:hypothetical protein [Streptomyces sp. NPDC060366]|uniref:hypothetical protein n=1 Tax=Streptomyces sp. NPDC060366 TaxID=3347105 RepID=UPI00364E68C5
MTARKTTAAPPPAAVAQDAHWAATRERLKNRIRPILTMTICDDHEAKAALAEALAEEQRATNVLAAAPDEENAKEAAAAATEALNRAQAAYDKVAITLRFQALDAKTYKELKAAHPPTTEQAEQGYEFNADTLGPIVIAASSLDGITEEDAVTYREEWSEQESDLLLNTAFAVQRQERMDLGKG